MSIHYLHKYYNHLSTEAKLNGGTSFPTSFHVHQAKSLRCLSEVAFDPWQCALRRLRSDFAEAVLSVR